MMKFLILNYNFQRVEVFFLKLIILLVLIEDEETAINHFPTNCF